MPLLCALACYRMVADESLAAFVAWARPLAKNATEQLNRAARDVEVTV